MTNKIINILLACLSLGLLLSCEDKAKDVPDWPISRSTAYGRNALWPTIRAAGPSNGSRTPPMQRTGHFTTSFSIL